MKKMILIAAAAVSLAACSNSTSTTTDSDDTMNSGTTVNTNTETNEAYAPGEGDVMRRDGKIVVYRNGAWVDADADVRLDDGTTVDRNGRLVRNDEEVELEDGEVVTRTGRFFDRAGKTINKGWQKTKEAVKDAGREIKEGANKLEDRVTNDRNDNNR